MPLRPSRYNCSVLTDEGQCLVYNTLSGALVRLSVEEAVGLSSVALTEEDALDFVQRGFLVEDGLDELALACHRRDLNRHLSHETNLVIVPTSDCNFACPDCFAATASTSMSRDTADQVLLWAEGRARVSRRLRVEWFGGEPLLAADLLTELSSALAQMCSQRGCDYQSTLVTNGYLMSSSMASRLREAGVTAVQIALDGTDEQHDRHRPYRDGSGTFERVWSGLLAAAGYMDVSVRVTVRPGTRPWELYRRIRQERSLETVRTYFSPAHDRQSLTPDGPRLCSPGVSFLRRTLAEVRERLDAGDPLSGFDVPFFAFHAGCIGRQPLAAAVGPDGSLYKCGKLVGRTAAVVGSVYDQGWAAGLVPGAMAWHLLPPQGEQCCDCQALPLCSGQCPASQLAGDDACPGTVGLLTEHILTLDRWLRATGGGPA